MLIVTWPNRFGRNIFLNVARLKVFRIDRTGEDYSHKLSLPLDGLNFVLVVLLPYLVHDGLVFAEFFLVRLFLFLALLFTRTQRIKSCVNFTVVFGLLIPRVKSSFESLYSRSKDIIFIAGA